MKKKFLSGLLVISVFSFSHSVYSLPQVTEVAEKQAGAEKIKHLLNRITFGCTYSDIGLATKMGIEKYIQAQLDPKSIPVPDDLSELSKAEALQAGPAELFIKYGRPAIKAALQNQTGKKVAKSENEKEFNNMVRDANERIYGDTALNRIARAVESPRQLEEVMTDFWFNHFNVSSDKGLAHLWVGSYEEKAIRPHVLGKFRDLLGATAHHAAMLFYLDNWQNSAPKASIADFTQELPNSKDNRRNFRGINENYARELMELHTLGVDGGYTQKDVTELARVLTGLGMVNRGVLLDKLNRQMRTQTSKDPGMTDRYVQNYGQVLLSDMLPGNKIFGSCFDEKRHDFGDKTILGQTIKGEGEREIEHVLDLLAIHPSTAKHISFKLAQYFVCVESTQS